MASWKKGPVRCRVCGVPFRDHPDEPCRERMGISPDYIMERVAQEEARERLENAIQLYSVPVRVVEAVPHKRRLTKQKPRRHSVAGLPNTAKKANRRKHAQTTLKRRKKSRRGVYN